jgi:hypothetical protein
MCIQVYAYAYAYMKSYVCDIFTHMYTYLYPYVYMYMCVYIYTHRCICTPAPPRGCAAKRKGPDVLMTTASLSDSATVGYTLYTHTHTVDTHTCQTY